MRHFSIRKLRLKTSSSLEKWPDIWIEEVRGIPTITVTEEWAKQGTDERRKRLLHEVLHTQGLQHGKIGKLNYSTHPEEDNYSKAMYRRILSGM